MASREATPSRRTYSARTTTYTASLLPFKAASWSFFLFFSKMKDSLGYLFLYPD
jgi:hypothetical protein